VPLFFARRSTITRMRFSSRKLTVSSNLPATFTHKKKRLVSRRFRLSVDREVARIVPNLILKAFADFVAAFNAAKAFVVNVDVLNGLGELAGPRGRSLLGFLVGLQQPLEKFQVLPDPGKMLPGSVGYLSDRDFLGAILLQVFGDVSAFHIG
jgi:hypothetical protein